VSQADNDKYYKNFYHVMSHQWQEEILGLFLILGCHFDVISP
jgi:hypothetical protein